MMCFPEFILDTLAKMYILLHTKFSFIIRYTIIFKSFLNAYFRRYIKIQILLNYLIFLDKNFLIILNHKDTLCLKY